MARPDSDRNLLFGIMALQMEFVTRDGLVDGMHAWVMEKHRPLGDLLVARGALSASRRALLEPLIDEHVRAHGGDPAASLAALSSLGGPAADLRRSVDDPDVLGSIARIPAAPPADPLATRAPDPSNSRPAAVRYRKVRDHAEGGLGVVYVARDEELNREVALKEIKARYADNPASQARFLLEAEITGGLEHPGIVPVYGLGSYEDGRPFYAMRFIKGDSLKEAIGRFHGDPTPPGDRGGRAIALRGLLRRFLDVCNAVAYAHSRGVLHRDLKPDNVMVGRYGETLVVDWGVAKAIGRSGGDGGMTTEEALSPSSAPGSDATLPGSVVGTPAYMSPEQADGRVDLLGPASDVYSLGATLYALLAGKAPFAGEAIGAVLAKVRRGEFPRPREVVRDVPRPLEAVCLKAMAVRAEDRYPSPKALADDVERWLADEPVTAWREPVLVKARRMASRHRTLVATAAAASVVAAIALGAKLASDRARGMALVESLKSAEIGKAPAIVDQLRGLRSWTAGRLRADFEASAPGSPERLRLALGLLPGDPGQVEFLLGRALRSDPATLGVVRDALRGVAGPSDTDGLWKVATGRGEDDPRFRAAGLLAGFAPDDPRWDGIGDELVRLLLRQYHLDPASFGNWSGLLAPALPRLVPRLMAVYDDPARPSERELTSRLLARHAAKAEQLVALVQRADEDDFGAFLARMRDDPAPSLKLLEAAIAEPQPEGDEASVETWARRRAQAAVAAHRLGRPGDAWPLLKQTPEPSRRSWMIERLAPLGVKLEELAARLGVEPDPGARRALVLAMGQADAGRLAEADRSAIVRRLLDSYRDDPDPGLHSAIGWLLRAWKLGGEVKGVDADLAGRPGGDRGWFVNAGGRTFVVIRGPADFPGGPGKDGAPPRRIARSFAMATTEVTVAEFEEFAKDAAGHLHLSNEPLYVGSVSPEPECPVNAVNWFYATMYCRWLSEREKIAAGQMCYPDLPSISAAIEEATMEMIPGHLSRQGYRLPTAAEWDYACQAGSSATRPFGEGTSLLSRYAWYQRNARERTRPVGLLKPNDFGLFDMLGNLREWGDDRAKKATEATDDPATSDPDSPITREFPRRRFGGSYRDNTDLLLSAYPDNWLAAARAIVSGFRIVKTLD